MHAIPPSADPTHDLQTLLRAALEAIPSAAFVLTLDGELLEANPSGRRWLALDETRRRLLGAAVQEGPPADFLVTKVSDDRTMLLLVHCGLASAADSALAWGFTPREREILALLREGRPNRTIAATLALAERAVETHLTAMFAKARVASRAELVARVASGSPRPGGR